MSDNTVVFGIIGGSIMLIGYLYLTVRQFIQLRRPKDRITWPRRIFFIIYLLVLFSIVPGLSYQIARLQGYEATQLRNIATVTGRVSGVLTLALLIMFVHYKIKEEDK
jgi:O-antigen/teichoic acid export membrane protein